MIGTTRVFDWLVVGLCLGAAYTVVPLWAPLVLSAWVAALLMPPLRRLSGDRHRKRSAALLTTALVVAVLVPLTLLGISLTGAALELARTVLQSKDQKEALRALMLDGSGLSLEQFDAEQLFQLARSYGQSAAAALGAVAGVTTKAAIGVVVFVLATYAFLVDGKRVHEWLAEHSLMKRTHFERLADAFLETGRGLLIGTGLTALIQGALATIGYLALGVPRAPVLGFLTAIAALIPSVGTALVWVPVTVGLVIAGRHGAAVAMLLVGLAVSVTDNFIRPMLSRRGSLALPTLVVFVAMLGGIGVFGGWGLLLGPLLVRLAVEGLEIIADARRSGGNKAPRRAALVARREQQPS